MTEQEIFLEALDREDSAAYLDGVCAGQPALRRRVEELLRCHHEDTTFLNVPAMEQLAEAEESLSFLEPSGQADSLGRLDHYEVLEVVGRGGTGVVLKARDTKLQRVVAVKALTPRLAAIAAARRRFVREAQAAAAVRDDNVVAIYAVNDDGPVPYLVMEYISGLTLEQRVQRDKALELKEILRIGMQIATGLAAAHAQGLVHRDIKPANILLENSVQRVKITDFGLARVAAEAGETSNGALAGTPMFMSPEQARGEPTDHRTDLFSLGSVLYTLCAGQPPFRADTTATVLRRVRADAPQPVNEINRNVPKWLNDLIAKLHAKEAPARPASAREVADLLSRELALLQQPPLTHHSTPLTSKNTGPYAQKAPISRRLPVFILLAGLVVAAAGFAVLLKGRHGGASESGEEEKNEPVESLELRRENISPTMLALAGGGDPAKAPSELAAVLGDGRFLLPRGGGVTWMQQSPDEKTLAVPLAGEVVLFEAQTGKYLRSLKGPGGRVMRMTFTRDSQLLAASSWYEGVDGAVRVWDLRSDKELFTQPVPGGRIGGGGVFSPDGKRLVEEGSEGLHVWDAHTGQETQVVPIAPAGCARLCFSPDGRRLAAALWNGRSVKVFDWNDEKLWESRILKGHSEPVAAVEYSPDGNYLASGTEKEFKLWEAKSLKEIRTVQTPAQELAFTPDSRILYASASNGKARPVHTWTRWDVRTQNELPALSVEVAVEPISAGPCLSRDGKVLYFSHGVNYASYVRAIDTASGKDVFPRIGHVAPLNAITISPNGRTLASGGEDRAVKVWNLADGRVIHSFTAHAGPVWGLAFSPNGKLLASGSRDGTIALWDLRRGMEIRALHGHSRSPSRIQFSPDGKTLAAGNENGSVKRWEVATGLELDSLSGHSGPVRCVAFGPDGTFLASGGEDKTVRLHSLIDGSSRKLMTPNAVNNVVFSLDGRTLAAVTDAPDATVRWWNVATGEETTRKGHTGHVHGLAFSSTVLATSSDDGTVRFWNLDRDPNKERVIGPGPFSGEVRAVTFTPDGHYLATANANGAVYLLRVDSHR